MGHPDQRLSLVVLCTVVLLLTGTFSTAEAGREVISLDLDWRFSHVNPGESEVTAALSDVLRLSLSRARSLTLTLTLKLDCLVAGRAARRAGPETDLPPGAVRALGE
eukprot:COSAG02_NODE_5778_length_4040_cov_5.246678_2_plen_107_part_00